MPTNTNAVPGQKYTFTYMADDGELYNLVASGQHIKACGEYLPVTSTEAPAFPKRWKPRKLHGVQTLDGRDRHASIVLPSQRRLNPSGSAEDWTEIVGFTIEGLGFFNVTGRTGEQRTIAAPLWDGVPTPAQGRVQVLYMSDEIIDDGGTKKNKEFLVTTNRQHAALLSATPPTGQYNQLPGRITPRHYGLFGDVTTGRDKKRTMLEIDPHSSNWTSDVPYTFNFGDTQAPINFTVTGRKSESETNGAPFVQVTYT